MYLSPRSIRPVVLAVASLILPALHAQDAGHLAINKDNRTIAVTATERVLNQADTATVHIGYLLYGPDKDTAYAAASKASNGIADALRAAGVPKDAIQSESQNIAPTEPFLLQQLTPVDKPKRAFTAQQSWTVRVNADDAAATLDLAVKAGANASGAIDWSLHDPNEAQAAAATKAIQRARTQATAMAAGLGVHLGPLLFASNQVDASPVRPVDRFRNGLQKATNSAEVKALAINTREIETSATVYAVFALE